jgi:hypothetical protein
MGDENTKLWKYNSKSTSAHKVSDGSASLQGNEENGFFSDAKLGNFIKGALSITASPDKIRIHGLWTLNNQLLSSIPSTIVTPCSVLNFDLPLSGALELMQESVAMMATLTLALA